MMKKGLLAIVLVAGMLTGCDYLSYGATSVEQVQQHAAQLEKKEVKLIGTVKGSTEFPFIALKTFILKDKTGEILVTTEQPLPNEGEKIALKGVVENAATLEGQSLGVHIKEVKRLDIVF